MFLKTKQYIQLWANQIEVVWQRFVMRLFSTNQLSSFIAGHIVTINLASAQATQWFYIKCNRLAQHDAQK